MMNEQEYLEQRLNDQIDWYEAKSARNQLNYKLLRTIELVTAALIPFTAALLEGWDKYAWLAAGLGALIAIAAAINHLYRFHDNWIQYRATAEQLKHDKYLFLTGTEPYAGKNAFTLLVHRVESLIAKETSSWEKMEKQVQVKDTDADPTP